MGTALLPEDEVEARIGSRLVLEVLDRLTPLQQTVLAMRWGWGVSRKEAASALGLSAWLLPGPRFRDRECGWMVRRKRSTRDARGWGAGCDYRIWWRESSARKLRTDGRS
jgi:DNA-directed RNA polymerase sigma subunit (sigma70/sigma32)